MYLKCPICRRDTTPESIYIPDFAGSDLSTMCRRINPAWEPKEGFCHKCLMIFGEMLGNLRRGPEKVNAGFPKTFFRYHLSHKERQRWHHIEPDIQKRSRDQISETVSKDAFAQGYERWSIFDENEVVVSRGE